MPNTLDEIWTIDVKKSMALPPEVVLRNLRRIVAPIVKAGKRKYKFRAVKETTSENTSIWVPQETRNGIVYSINTDYPVLRDILAETKDKRKLQTLLRILEQNIPVNAIHTDFYDDKKFAFEDVDIAYQNVLENLRNLLRDIPPEQREDEFNDLMSIMPFAEYDIKFTDLGEFI
jgi:hypothetical protein